MKHGFKLALALSLALFLCIPSTGFCQETIKVGIILPATGEKAKFGEIERKSFEMALEEINAAGSAQGKKIDDRMDNLIHASANHEDAEREIKLWFKPNDIPPLMRPYPTAASEAFYYYQDGKLLDAHKAGAVCLLAPGEPVWSSDLDALHAIRSGGEPSCSLNAVAAKYMINEGKENA